MQYEVGVGAEKVNSHLVLSKYGWWGLLPLVQKGQTTHAVEDAKYVIGVGAKRSTHTLYLANMGGGDHATFSAKRSNPMQ